MTSIVMALLLPGGIAEIVFVLWLTTRRANAHSQVADNDRQVCTTPGAALKIARVFGARLDEVLQYSDEQG